MEPAEIASLLRETASYLELEDDRYRAKAYQRAASSVEASNDLARLVAEDRLTELPGIGASLARAVVELSSRGTMDALERLRERWPKVVVELAGLPGVGVPKARKLFEAFGVSSLDELAELCEGEQVRTLPGFGKVSEARILDAIRGRHLRGGEIILEAAHELGGSLAQHLRGMTAARRVEVCGAARRWVEVIDRLALAVATDRPDAVRDRMRHHPLVVSLTSVSPHVDLARLASGVSCELHTARPDRFGAAMIIATGSTGHVDGLRARASARQLVLEDIESPDEAGVYRALGLPELPPEVRDGTDELAEAAAGIRFDDLITAADITGAVHCHTTYSDGKNSIEQMATAAAARGLGFLTITDHSQSAGYAGGLTVERMREQWREIAAVQDRVPIRLLRGTESDILADGRLDYPDAILGDLEVVIASVHQRYKLDEDATTRRLVAAMRHPVFKIWGHALGRLLLRRPPIACRFDEVLDAIADSPTAIEINGDPHRLDLDPARARRAHARGARFVLSTDAHSVRQLAYLDNAVAMGRRARLRKADVLNTLPADEFARVVRPRRAAG